MMFDTFYNTKHRYTFTVDGLRVHDEVFASRGAANNYMYELIGKYNLQLTNVYDDHHFKTYIFANGVRIHINRE